MKNIIFFCIPILFFTQKNFAQNYEYVVETTLLDSFEVIENDKSRLIKSNNQKEKLQFRFRCKSPQNTYIKMYCKSCEGKLTVKLFDKQKGAYTEWIPLKHGAQKSVARCFEEYTEKKDLWSIYNNAVDVLYDFWNSFGDGRSERRRIPILKGEDVEPGDPKLKYLRTDYDRYLKKEDFAVQFRNLEDYPVKSIYIISHKGKLIFHAGDPDILDDLFELPEKASPAIEKVLEIEGLKEDVETTYELNWDGIKPYLLDELKTGQYYQIGIELEEDSSVHNPYLFNFRVFTTEEFEELIEVFKHD